MYEHPSFSLALKELSVEVHHKARIQGSGILYKLKSDQNKVCLITAKHCLIDDDKDVLINQDISIRQSDAENIYHLTDRDEILLHPTVDLAVIVMCLEDLPLGFLEIPQIDLAEDNAGEKDIMFYGFPGGFNESTLVRINGQLLPPISNGIIDIESDIRSELNLTENTVVGLSGSGAVLRCSGNIYLLGIITDFVEWGRFTGISIKFFNELIQSGSLGPEPVSILEGNPELINAFKILKGNSDTLLGNINDNIGGIRIDRTGLIESAVSKLSETRVLLISGIAGAGKSTFCKILLKHLETTDNAKIISFYGTQVCKDSSVELLSMLGISNKLGDVLESRDLLGLKIIYIDSAEKGFELHQIEVIKELLKLTLVDKQLKLILSVRTYALTLSTFGLFSSVSVGWNRLDLNLLDDLEIKPVVKAFPNLQKWLNNPKIETFVRTPFYLNLLVMIVNGIDNGDLNELTLKNRLWQDVIRKDSPQRESLFEKIALNRAKIMRPYVMLDAQQEDEILLGLLSDNLITENIDVFGLRSYAPAHDILEDWALVRYMRMKFAGAADLESFVAEIGSTYAMCRGFRFWLQEIYRVEKTNAQAITLNTLTSSSIDSSWKDEVLIALLNSSVCGTFLNANKNILLENDAKLFIRCIHLLRTACKSMQGTRIAEDHLDEREYMTSDLLTSTGPGWNAVIIFIGKHFAELHNLQTLIKDLLLDWGRQDSIFEPNASISACELIFTFIKGDGKDFVKRRNEKDDKQLVKLLKLLFDLCADNKPKIEAFVKKSFDYIRKTRADDDLSEEAYTLGFHQQVIEMCLDYNSSEQLCRFLPELIWKIALYTWTDTAEKEVEKMRKEKYKTDVPRLSYLIDYARKPEKEELFGLSREARRDFYPESALQTPFPHLLKYHSELSVDQFSILMNRALESYKNELPGELKKITIKLKDNSTRDLYGNPEIWRMYRGNHNVPKLLACLHMALENHLLEICKTKAHDPSGELGLIVNQLFARNISVSVCAVIASVATAYPFRMGTDMLPVFSFKEAYKWDMQRRAGERDVFTPPDISGRNPGAQKERIISKKLPHRDQSLDFLILKMSFYEGFSEPIAGFIKQFNDDLQAKGTPDWPNWTYVLIRIDRAKYQVAKTTETGVIIEPELPVKMKTEMEEARRSFMAESGINIWNWCHMILDKNQQENNTFENWKHFSSLSKELLEANTQDNKMYNAPTAIAEIGLRFYKEQLTQAEFDWSIEVLLDAADFFIKQESVRFSMDLGRYSSWNQEIVFAFLPNLLGPSYALQTNEQAKELLYTAINIFDIDDGIKMPLFEKMGHGCWIHDRTFADKCFTEFVWNAVEPDWRKKADPAKTAFLPELLFDQSYDCMFNLDKAFLFLSESGEIDDKGYSFLRQYQKFLIDNTWETGVRKKRSDHYYNGPLHFQFKYGKLVLANKGNNSAILFSSLTDSFFELNTENFKKASHESFELVGQCIKSMFDYEDKNIETAQFFYLWQLLYYKTLKFGKTFFIKYLFLDWYWRDSADSWPVIKENRGFFIKIIYELGEYDLLRCAALLAGVGFEDLFPESILLFKNLIQKETGHKWVNNYSAEKYIQRAYFRKGSQIKQDKDASRNFTIILDKMIAEGSSVAFLVKESFVSA